MKRYILLFLFALFALAFLIDCQQQTTSTPKPAPFTSETAVPTSVPASIPTPIATPAIEALVPSTKVTPTIPDIAATTPPPKKLEVPKASSLERSPIVSDVPHNSLVISTSTCFSKEYLEYKALARTSNPLLSEQAVDKFFEDSERSNVGKFLVTLLNVRYAQSVGEQNASVTAEKAESGNKFVLIDLQVENLSLTISPTIDHLGPFKLLDGQQYSYDVDKPSSNKARRPLDVQGQLLPGQFSRGEIVFRIPQNGSDLRLFLYSMGGCGKPAGILDLSIEASMATDRPVVQKSRVMEFAVGDSFKSGKVKVTLSNVLYPQSENRVMGLTSGASLDNTKHLILDLIVENVSSEKYNLSSLIAFVLTDEKGYAYKISRSSSVPISRPLNLTSELLPSLPTRGEILFEIPSEASGLRLFFIKSVDGAVPVFNIGPSAATPLTRTQQLPIVPLPESTQKGGSLEVVSKPTGALIYLDGQKVELLTPVTIANIAPGRHQVQLKKTGYRDSPVVDVIVSPGLTDTVLQELEEIAYSLKTFGDPTGASLYIDGYYMGVTPISVPNLRGTHKLKFAKQGYKPYLADVSMTVDQTVSYKLTPADLDDTKIAFVSYRSGKPSVFLMNSDGTGQVEITKGPALSWGPAWAPTGQFVAFTCFSHDSPQVCGSGADGTRSVTLTADTKEWLEGQWPAWSPDGKFIAFSSRQGANYEIFTMNTDGSNRTRLTNNTTQDFGAAWSSDGKRIAFHSGSGDNYQIYVMNSDGSGLKRLTQGPATNEWPAWSPDGSKIAFVSYRDGTPEIYLMNTDGTGLVRLTRDSVYERNIPEGFSRRPSWSPDGKKIAFTGGKFDIYVINSDGSGMAQLTKGPGQNWGPAWSPFLY